MASNQRYFYTCPLFLDSSKLRFAQACQSFDLELFNKAAKRDKNYSVELKNRIILISSNIENKQNYLRIENPKKESLAVGQIDYFFESLEVSPNAPNLVPALSLAAA